jgi:hypothetical protein
VKHPESAVPSKNDRGALNNQRPTKERTKVRTKNKETNKINNQSKQAINQQTKQTKLKLYGALMVAQAVKKLPVVTEPTGSLPCSKQPATSLKFEPHKANTTPPKYLLKIHFNITLQSMRRSCKWHVPLRVFSQLFLSILSSRLSVLHALPISSSYV